MNKIRRLITLTSIPLIIIFLVHTTATIFAQAIDHQKISDTAGGFSGLIDDDDLFGWAPINIGDLDGDGNNDLAVGTPGDDDGGNNRGAVWILFLEPNGTVKSHQKISDTEGGFTGILDDEDEFGHSMAPLGDYDGDGVLDIAVGALMDDDGGTNHGAFWLLYLNTNGTVKDHQKISDTQGGFTGTLNDDDGFGHGITRLGDLDGDGTVDLAAATGHIDHEGVIWMLFMNTDGTVRDYQRIAENEGGFTGNLDPEDELGHDLDYLGDLDGDGILDLVAGSPKDDDGGQDRGAFYILFLNSNGTVKSQQKISDIEGGFTGILDDGDRLGHPPSNAGDLDGDGVIDLLAGAPFDDDGSIDTGAFWIIFLNSDGSVKNHQKVSQTMGGFSGSLDSNDLFSHIVVSLGDLNDDGATDFAVGAPHDDDGGTDRGAVWVIFSDYAGNKNPTADFSYNKNSLNVIFIDESSDSDGEIVDWLWDFGDGETSTSQNIRHTYQNPGTFTVSLTVTDDGGLKNTTSQLVTVGEVILSVTPLSVEFGYQEVGKTSSPAEIALENDNSSLIQVSNVSIEGSDAIDFAHDFSGPVTIPGGDHEVFYVTFTPRSVFGETGENIFRVNAGGPLLPSGDSVPLDWGADEAQNPSLNVNSGQTSTGSLNGSFTVDASVPFGTPQELFETYRSDAYLGPPEMEWDFPVQAGEQLEVRLYFIQFFDCTGGGKVFDVEIEGIVLLDNYDVFVDVGCSVGVMKSFMITTSDTNLDIDFVRNSGGPPLINGMEIIKTTSSVKITQLIIEHTGTNSPLFVDLRGEAIPNKLWLPLLLK